MGSNGNDRSQDSGRFRYPWRAARNATAGRILPDGCVQQVGRQSLPLLLPPFNHRFNLADLAQRTAIGTIHLDHGVAAGSRYGRSIPSVASAERIFRTGGQVGEKSRLIFSTPRSAPEPAPSLR